MYRNKHHHCLMRNYTKVCLALVCCFMLSCKKEKQLTILEVTVLNPKEESTIMLTNNSNNEYLKELKLSKHFIDTLDISKSDYHNFFFNRFPLTSLYIEKGKRCRIIVNTDVTPNSVSFAGDNQDINEYLMYKRTSDSNYFPLKEKAFLAKENSRRTDLIAKIEGFSPSFKEKELKEIDTEYYRDLFLYPRAHGRISQQPNFEVSANYYDFTQNIKPTEVGESMVAVFMLTDYYKWLANKKAEKYEGNIDMAFFHEVAKDLPNGLLKDEIFSINRSNATRLENPLEEIKQLVNTNMENVEKRDDLITRLTSLQQLKKGKKAPFFEAENINGEKMDVEDFKGKLTYIDVWATTCEPCIKEMPALKKLESKFKNVNFVSLSIDSKGFYDRWKGVIKEKELTEESQFINFKDKKFGMDYVISGIPRYIVLDKEGQIINAFAKGPSDPELEKELIALGATM